MSTTDIGAIVGLVIANLICVWILFFRGVDWLENSPFAAIWPYRRFGFSMSNPEIPAIGFKVVAGFVWIVAIAGLVTKIMKALSP